MKNTSTITSKYQTVIPAPIRKELGIKKNEKLTWQIVKKGKHPIVAVSPKPKNWSKYISGLGKEIWKGINTDKYLKELREEWHK